MSPRRFAAALAAVLALFLAYQAGAASSRYAGSGVLEEAVKAITRNGAHSVDPAELRRAAVEGMLRASGDRWSSYYEATEFSDFSESLSGRYTGLGLWLRPGASGGTEVASVQSKSVAATAGMRPGDAIVLINGADVASESVSTVVARLRGEVGSYVSIGVVRDGDVKMFGLTRKSTSTSDVTIDRIDDQVLLIRVAAFSSGVGSEVNRAVDSIRHQQIILDLRNNAGGMLEEARQVASAFLDGGVVVSYERHGSSSRILKADIGGDTKSPLVIMVNGETASAAEVVAAALQDRNRAVIVGSRTYGKGSVQEPQLLSDGSAIELTVGRYRTPSGRYLEGVGLEPDVKANSTQVESRALQILKALGSVTR